MTDGDSCCIVVAAKNISPTATLSPFFLLLLSLRLYLETSLFPPSRTSFPARAARFPSPFTLPTTPTSFRFVLLTVSCCRLLWREFVNASHNRTRVITYSCILKSRSLPRRFRGKDFFAIRIWANLQHKLIKGLVPRELRLNAHVDTNRMMHLEQRN